MDLSLGLDSRETVGGAGIQANVLGEAGRRQAATPERESRDPAPAEPQPAAPRRDHPGGRSGNQWWGWTLVLNPDGTTTAWNKDKTKVLHSHGPPVRPG